MAEHSIAASPVTGTAEHEIARKRKRRGLNPRRFRSSPVAGRIVATIY